MRSAFLFTIMLLGSLKTHFVLGLDKIEDAFTKVYKDALWGKDDSGLGTSGGGSLAVNTVEYRSYLEKFLKDYQINSVVDVGCGDWTFSQLIDWGSIRYIGLDVVESVIRKNSERFQTSNITFEQKNAIQSELPKADLLICKEVLQHLSNENVQLFLKKIDKFKYCIITNDVNPWTLTSDNPDISPGDYRHLDLTKPPFSIDAEKVLIYKVPDGFREVKQVLLITNAS